MKLHSLAGLLSGSALLFAAPVLHAQTEQGAAVASNEEAGAFDRFVPRPDASRAEMKIDYAFLDDALSYMVLRMGPSTRQGLGRPNASIGTRQVYGHDSRFRLEGNRVAFSLLDEETFAPLAEYRRDLERIGSEVDIASLPRNEQLAYWINLHNVAIIEQIAAHYPVVSPSRIKIGPDQTPLDEARFIEVAGVKMSPKDIRTAIVFANWDDPLVIYGFFRGDIGGPSIQREAFTGTKLGALLRESANEFVNSLRGVESQGKTLLVSRIYEEAAPYFFPHNEPDLRSHLAKFAEEDVQALLAKTSAIKTNQYEDTVADLAGGEREPEYNFVQNDDRFTGVRLTSSMRRMLAERNTKYEKLRKEGRVGRVIVLPGSSDVEESLPDEVD